MEVKKIIKNSLRILKIVSIDIYLTLRKSVLPVYTSCTLDNCRNVMHRSPPISNLKTFPRRLKRFESRPDGGFVGIASLDPSF